MLSDKPVGPAGGQVPCSGCGAILDPLRAGHVAIFRARFHYFCNHHDCRARFLGEPSAAPPEQAEPTPTADIPETVRDPVQPAEAIPPAELTVPETVPTDAADLLEPLPAPIDEQPLVESPVPERRDMGLALVALALIAGMLTMTLEFASTTKLVLVARVVLVVVGTCALIGGGLTARPDPAEPNRIAMTLAPSLASLVAIWGLVSRNVDQSTEASFLAGTIVTVSAVVAWLLGTARRPVWARQHSLTQLLDVAARRLADDSVGAAKELTFEICAGERVLVEPGETVPVDLELLEGEVEVVPWPGSPTRVRRRAGDAVVAGARVTQGQLRGTCTWAGDERALVRSLLGPKSRCDVYAMVARLARSVAERWALAIALLSAIMVVTIDWGRWPPIHIAMIAVAVYAALGNGAVGTLAGLAIARGALDAVARGVVYNTAQAWDASARVHAAVLCARGTLLRGEPELAEVEAIGDKSDADDVVALAAGALGTDVHPTALALRRAARSRGISPDPVRNPRSLPGLGVSAVASTGESLCVGSRQLMLDRRISVAVVEQRVSQLEANGRTVVLVARAGRLMGIVALQDGLRSGARAAVQHLHDAKVEPVLMSSDSRETCEAVGRSVDIDHLRPEVSGDERAEAVERLRETGACVAVLGHVPADEDPLAAADVSVVLAAAGRAPDDFSVSLVSDDVRDASLALALARRTHAQALQVLALVLAPALFGCLLVTVMTNMMPPEFAPLAVLVGAVAAVIQLRSFDRPPSD